MFKFSWFSFTFVKHPVTRRFSPLVIWSWLPTCPDALLIHGLSAAQRCVITRGSAPWMACVTTSTIQLGELQLLLYRECCLQFMKMDSIHQLASAYDLTLPKTKNKSKLMLPCHKLQVLVNLVPRKNMWIIKNVDLCLCLCICNGMEEIILFHKNNLQV